MEQHLHQEISTLKTEIAKLGGLVEDSIGKALTAIKTSDKDLAKEVRRGDDAIDLLEVEVEERILKMFALYQPVARDLRFLVTALKVNNELEHIGDLAQSVAAKVKSVPAEKAERSRMDVFEMGEKAQRMLATALDGFLTGNSQKARQVIRDDDEIDAMHGHNHAIVHQLIKESDDFGTLELGLLSISRSLERIADTATSIAEDVIYLVEAQIVRHHHDDD